MRFLRNFLIFLLWLLVSAVSVMGALDNYSGPFLDPERPKFHSRITAELARYNVTDFNFRLNVLLLLICALIAVLTLALLLRRRKPLRIERHVDGGTVLMSAAATKHYIATALAPFEDLVCRRIDLNQTKKGLEAIVRADLRTQTDVPGLEKRLIQRVHSALTEDLGIENVHKVNVIINDFGLPKGTPVKPVEPEAEPEESGGKKVRPALAVTPVTPVQPAAPVQPVEAVAPVAPVQASAPVAGQEPLQSTRPAAEAAPSASGLFSPAEKEKPVVNERGNLVLNTGDEKAEGNQGGNDHPGHIDSKPDEKAP